MRHLHLSTPLSISSTFHRLLFPKEFSLLSIKLFGFVIEVVRESTMVLTVALINIDPTAPKFFADSTA